jgi:hypothetical protein
MPGGGDRVQQVTHADNVKSPLGGWSNSPTKEGRVSPGCLQKRVVTNQIKGDSVISILKVILVDVVVVAVRKIITEITEDKPSDRKKRRGET